jgi:hypothetical protein
VRDFVSLLFDDPDRARTVVSGGTAVKNYSILCLLPLFVACAQSNFGDDSTGDSGNPGDDGGTGDETTPVDDSGNPPPSNAPLASGLTVTGVTVNQGVEVNVVKNGAPATKNAPIIAGRPGLVRVFVNPSSAFSHALTGELTITTGGTPKTFTASLKPTTASTDANMGSTFNFTIVDGTEFGTDTTFLVQIKDPQGSGSGDTTAQYPNSGTATALGVKNAGSVKINLFPIKFSSGGGTPATGAIDVNAYQKIIMSLYPAATVTINVQSTLTYTGAIPDAYDQSGAWEYLLSFMQKKRAADPTPDVYYYGAFAPTSSFASFCSSGCVAGLSGIPSGPTNYSQKASIGLAYGGDATDQQATGQTMAHEVGHGHGREHSPTSQSVQYCSTPSGVDPGYPYSYGGIGVWGWDIINLKAIDPTQYYDVMGYCEMDWISDYTYSALYSWVAADNGFDMMQSAPVTYRQIFVKADGSIEVGDAFPVYGPMAGEQHTVTFDDGHTATGFYFPYDHVGGGYVLVPEPARFNSLQVKDFSKVSAIPH